MALDVVAVLLFWAVGCVCVCVCLFFRISCCCYYFQLCAAWLRAASVAAAFYIPCKCLRSPADLCVSCSVKTVLLNCFMPASKLYTYLIFSVYIALYLYFNFCKFH